MVAAVAHTGREEPRDIDRLAVAILFDGAHAGATWVVIVPQCARAAVFRGVVGRGTAAAVATFPLIAATAVAANVRIARDVVRVGGAVGVDGALEKARGHRFARVDALVAVQRPVVARFVTNVARGPRPLVHAGLAHTRPFQSGGIFTAAVAILHASAFSFAHERRRDE